jgi:hypothetical protein
MRPVPRAAVIAKKGCSMTALRLTIAALGLALLSACVSDGNTDPGGPATVAADGSPVTGEARGE